MISKPKPRKAPATKAINPRVITDNESSGAAKNEHGRRRENDY
jgi:hypothetical protein